MDRIKPTAYQNLVKIFKGFGCKYSHIKGDHMIFHHQDATRPVVIPMYKEVPVFIIKNNMKVVGMTNQEYLRLWKETK